MLSYVYTKKHRGCRGQCCGHDIDGRLSCLFGKVTRKLEKLNRSLDSPMAATIRRLSSVKTIIVICAVVYVMSFMALMVLSASLLGNHKPNEFNDLRDKARPFVEGLLIFWCLAGVVTLPVVVFVLKKKKDSMEAESRGLSQYELEATAWCVS